jgi:hypothetical protein
VPARDDATALRGNLVRHFGASANVEQMEAGLLEATFDRLALEGYRPGTLERYGHDRRILRLDAPPRR